MSAKLSREERALVEKLVKRFEDNHDDLQLFVNAVRDRVQETKPLFRLIHSLKWRMKDPHHLREKLIRKILEAKGKGDPFNVSEENFFARINDLVGVRILHLHTRQMEEINAKLRAALDEGMFKVIEGPVAKTWDSETQQYFEKLSIATEDSKSLYTSVHYVIESNTKTKYTCEIQVRTLAEELWGEVSHSFNYPEPTKSAACAEQIKVLARVTSSCSRLVDSVFHSLDEYKSVLESKSATNGVTVKKKKHSKDSRRVVTIPA